jgi:hypothetical protein
MIIIGVDFHPEFQQIALLNTTTGEVEEKRLAQSRRGGEVLPSSRECGRKSAHRHGGQWARTVVRASRGRVAV